MTVPAPSESRRWHNVTVVREQDPRRMRWVLILFAGILAAAIPVAAYLVQQMRYVEARYRTEDLRGRLTRLVETERRLRIERATLERLPRVEERAQGELGLVHPTPRQRVVVRSSAPDRGSAASRNLGDFSSPR